MIDEYFQFEYHNTNLQSIMSKSIHSTVWTDDANSEISSCEDIIRDSSDMKNFIQKSFILGISPHMNMPLYHEALDYVSSIIDDLFITSTINDHDHMEFDNFMRMLFNNPERPYSIKGDMIHNYSVYCIRNNSEKAVDKRMTIFKTVINRIYVKHTEHTEQIKKCEKGEKDISTISTIRVGNLMTTHTREEIICQLRLAFSKYGMIYDIKIPIDYSTGNPRGYAFIEFINPLIAATALKNTQGKLMIGPRPVRIDYALGEKRTFG